MKKKMGKKRKLKIHFSFSFEYSPTNEMPTSLNVLSNQDNQLQSSRNQFVLSDQLETPPYQPVNPYQIYNYIGFPNRLNYPGYPVRAQPYIQPQLYYHPPSYANTYYNPYGYPGTLKFIYSGDLNTEIVWYLNG